MGKAPSVCERLTGNNASGITPKHVALPRVCKQVFDLSNEEETTVKFQPVKKVSGARKTVMDKAIQSLSCEERTKRLRVKVCGFLKFGVKTIMI